MEEQHHGIVEDDEVVFHGERSMFMDFFLMGGGLVCLVIGSEAMVSGSVATAKFLGVPEVVIGLTMVAAGTSLPELAVCVVAALKKHGDITVGNVLGSNTFNALLILGTVTVLAPIVFQVDGFALTGDAGTLFFDIPFCVLICGLVVPLMAQGKELSRANGIMLICVYLLYISFLIYREMGPGIG